MKITADTNLLVRAAVVDDEGQAASARKVMAEADAVIVPIAAVLEFVWVLRRIYRFSRPEVARAVETLIASTKVHLAGGDFADGVIAAAGAGMGGETFVSFDRKAISRIMDLGLNARHPAELA
jgi:predicted nucleic-acid-binding protein